jgi:hypothetical protein
MSITFLVTTSILILILTISTYIAIWSRRATNARLISLLVLVPCVLVGLFSIGANLGSPTYCAVGWTIPKGKLDVLGFKIVKDYRTYLLLNTSTEPVYCWVPYNAQQASTLQEGKSTKRGSTLEGDDAGLLRGFGFGHEDDPQPLTIHENPQEPNPPKHQEETQTFGE